MRTAIVSLIFVLAACGPDPKRCAAIDRSLEIFERCMQDDGCTVSASEMIAYEKVKRDRAAGKCPLYF